MSGPKGYNSYRGRGPIGKIILIVLLVLVILAAVAFILLQQYIVYDESGTPHFQLPEPAPTEAVTPPPAEGDAEIDLTIEEAEPGPVRDVRALQLPQMPLSVSAWEQVWQERLLSAATNAVVLTVKDSGRVYFDSAAASAVEGNIVQTEGDTAVALAAMTASNTYAIARLSCFRDELVSAADVEGMGLKNTGGYIFYDGKYQRWLDPGKPAARKYLCDIAAEAAALGFDEILLTDVTYPTQGKLDKIAYGDAMKDEQIKAFLTELRAALADHEVRLSIELPAAVLTDGRDNVAGLLLADIAPLVDCVYAPAAEAEASALANAVTAANAGTEFVPETAKPFGTRYLLLS